MQPTVKRKIRIAITFSTSQKIDMKRYKIEIIESIVYVVDVLAKDEDHAKINATKK